VRAWARPGPQLRDHHGGRRGQGGGEGDDLDIEQAFDSNLAALDWMDDAAKKASLYKLRKIDNKVAYPEKWRDYTRLSIGAIRSSRTS